MRLWLFPSAGNNCRLMRWCRIKRILCAAAAFFMLFAFWTPAFGLATATPSGIPLSGLEAFIDDYMSRYIGKTSPGASVSVVSDGEIVFLKAYGFSDLENQIPVSTDTVFEYGSVSKLFVYTAIMRLAEQGRLDLNADIRQYLPVNFLKKLKYDKPVTMLDIMNHTTGFEDHLFDIILTDPKQYPCFEATLLNSQPGQVYEPGTITAYSNYAVALAAFIAERMLGQEFHQCLMDTVFIPLGMDMTSAHPTLSDRPALTQIKANGYIKNQLNGFNKGSWSYVPLYPVGGINGTAEDLARFAIALMPAPGEDCPLFEKRETLEEMLSQTHPMGPGVEGFAHGFIELDGELRTLGHGGNTAYFSAQFNIVPQALFGVVVLTNAANEMDITSGLTMALLGKRYNDVQAGKGLPDASIVEGYYIQARSMHSSFLELYGYLAPLRVTKLDDAKIQLGLAGQSSIIVQTQPFVYERIEAEGELFRYNFGKVYFQVQDGKVIRMSGDFLPLKPGRTMPWLVACLLIAGAGGLYFISGALIVLIKKLKSGRHSDTRRFNNTDFLIFSAAAAAINNGVLLARMLLDNYRSFSEVRIHILLNYPLYTLAAVFCFFVIRDLINGGLKPGQKCMRLITLVLGAAFFIVLANWHFLDLML